MRVSMSPQTNNLALARPAAVPAPTYRKLRHPHADSRPALTSPECVATVDHRPHRNRLWRSTCMHLMAPMLRGYDRYGTSRLHRHGFVSQRVDVDGLKMHAMRAKGRGTLPPVVVIHGLSGSISAYHSLLLKLQLNFSEVLAVDLPGHGSSIPYARISMDTFIGATRTTLDTLIEQPSIVFGHSLGGFVAAHYASLSPHNVAGLVLAAPAGGPVDPDMRCKMVRLFEVRTHQDAVALVRRTFSLPKQWMTQLLAAATQVRFLNASMQAMVHSKLSMERLPRHLLRNLQPPTMLLWGENEQLIPAQHLDYFKAYLPENTTVKILKGVNHSNIAGSPSPVFAELEHFAKRHRVKRRLHGSPSRQANAETANF